MLYNINSNMEDHFSWYSTDTYNWPKSSDWFWAVGIIAVSAAILALFFNNPLFSLLILLIAFTASLNATKEPQPIKYEINKRGVLINDRLYPYSSLEAFWITDHFKGPRALIRSKKTIMPYLIVPIEDYDPHFIHDFLSVYLIEEEMEESFFQVLLERLGF